MACSYFASFATQSPPSTQCPRQSAADCLSHSGELQEVVRATRGGKLDTSNEDDLWSGRVWTGRQAAKLGLIDHVGTLESVCKQKFGEKVRCRESPWHSCG